MMENSFSRFAGRKPIWKRTVRNVVSSRFPLLILACFFAFSSGRAEARYDYELEFGENRIRGLHCDFYRVSPENGGVWWHCHGDCVVGGRLVSRVDVPITPNVPWALMARASLVACEMKDSSAAYDVELCPEVRFAENGVGKFVTKQNRMLKVEARKLSFGDMPPFLAQCARLLDECREGGVVMCSSGFADVQDERVRYALFMSRRGNLLLVYETGASGVKSLRLEVVEDQVVIPRELLRRNSPDVKKGPEWELFAGVAAGSEMRRVDFTFCHRRMLNGTGVGISGQISVKIDLANLAGLSGFMRDFEYHGKSRWQIDKMVPRRFEDAF